MFFVHNKGGYIKNLTPASPRDLELEMLINALQSVDMTGERCLVHLTRAASDILDKVDVRKILANSIQLHIQIAFVRLGIFTNMYSHSIHFFIYHK